MKAGQLNSMLTIQRKTGAKDPAGQPLNSWSDVAVVWGDIRTPSGMGTIKGDASASIVQASIRIRYRADIVADMRAVHDGTNFRIRAVLPDRVKKQYLDLVCEVV